MALLLLKVDTDREWVNEFAEIPVIGSVFLFALIFLPAVILSFIFREIIPGLNGDIGFTKAMLVLLPGCNLFMWLKKIKLYCFFLPSWLLFGVIALVKAILMITGVDDGQ